MSSIIEQRVNLNTQKQELWRDVFNMAMDSDLYVDRGSPSPYINDAIIDKGIKLANKAVDAFNEKFNDSFFPVL